ncbi:MAG: hypothetical protein AB7V13_21105, partial [Pseudorhodoplanes sp.]
HHVTGESPDDIVAGIAAFPMPDGRAAFVGDGVDGDALGAYLESRGWTELFFEDRPAIPWTCIVSLCDPSHCFSIVDGRIYDRFNGWYQGSPIISIYVPPKGRDAKDRR